MTSAMPVRSSIVGFKAPGADLHKKSPGIFITSLVVTVVAVAVGVNLPLISREKVEKKVETPPVIIQLENIPETRQVVRQAAPRLAIPLEVADDTMPDDVTIESTDLDVEQVIEPAPEIEVPEVEVEQVEQIEEEVFELFAVEEQPELVTDSAPEYPEAARQAGIEGVVTIRALVGKDGRVEKVEILKGPGELQDAAAKAALGMVFKPAKQNDMAVKCWVQRQFRFTLE